MDTSGNAIMHAKARRVTDTEFAPFISNLFFEKFGNSYDNYEIIGNKWRDERPWSAAAQNMLILKSRLFLMTLDSDDKDSTNLGYLCCLAHMMAYYLSEYVKQSPEFNGNRKAAKKFLGKQLFSDFSYIINLETKQAAKRAAITQRRENNKKRKQNRKKEQELIQRYNESMNYKPQMTVIMRSRRK